MVVLTENIEEAFSLILEGRLEEGHQFINEALTHEHMTDELRFEIAEGYQSLGFMEEAFNIMQYLVEKYPMEPECQLFYIELLIELGKEEEALDTLYTYKELFTAKEDQIRSVMLMADIYLGQGLPEVAEEQLKNLLKNYPNEQLLHTALAEVYYQQEKYQAAIEHIQLGTEYTSYAMLADCYAHVGRFEEALEEYKHAVTAETPSAELYFGYGYVAYQLKDFDIAIDKWKYALELDPHYTKVYPLLIQALLEQHHQVEALEYTKMGLEYDSTNPQLFYLAAKLSHQLEKDHKQALEFAHQALALDDQHYEALCWLKDYHLRDSAWEEALPIIEQLIDSHPQQGDLWIDKGEVLEELDQLKEAEEAYKNALNIDATNAELLNRLGFLMRNLGNIKEAIQYWQRSVALDPNQIEILDLLEDYEQGVY